MHIMIDGMNLALHQGTGVATYARNLSHCIRQNGHEISVLYGREMPGYSNEMLREVVFYDQTNIGRSTRKYITDIIRSLRPEMASHIPLHGHVEKSEMRQRLPSADRFYNIPHLFFKSQAKFNAMRRPLVAKTPGKVDIAHWTYPTPTRLAGAKNVYTLHDLVPLKLPYATLDNKSYYYRLIKWIAATADHIITVSESSKRDIIDMFGVDPARVTNTYQSAEISPHLLGGTKREIAADFRAISSFNNGDFTPVQFGEKTELALKPNGYFLYLGALEPKKNISRIIEAYLSSGATQDLVVVGRIGWQVDKEMKIIKNAANIHYMDYLPWRHVVRLLSGARALIFPSLYEGFGLPVLEAFQCGAPVITANASSTAEIAGDAALLVDPYKTTEIRDAIKALSAPGSSRILDDMRAKGLARAADFSQDVISQRLEDCYQKIMAA